MAEVRYKEEKLSNLFDNRRGKSKYTKKYCNENKGEYEVYTGTTIGSFGFINSYDYDEPLLTYTTDGENAATIKILRGKYSVGGHRAILFPKNKNIVIDYFKWTLQKLFFDNVKKGDVPSITWSRIKKLLVLVPIDCDGNYDIEKQKEIVKKHEIIAGKKKKLKENLEYLKYVQVDFMATENSKYKEYKVSDVFDIQRGKSIYTKTYCKNNNGEYPVYSADNNNPLAYRNDYDFDGKYLSSSINGIAGVLTILDGKFSINADRVVFIPKLKNINLDYVKNILEPILRNKNKGRKGLKGKNEFTKLTPSMIKDEIIPIPLDAYGEVCLKKQSIIASKYKIIDVIKKEMENRLSELINIDLF